MTFERIDQKRRFEAIRDATRIETIEINESEEEEEKEAKRFASERRRGASAWSHAAAAESAATETDVYRRLGNEGTMREYDFVEGNENIWRIEK